MSERDRDRLAIYGAVVTGCVLSIMFIIGFELIVNGNLHRAGTIAIPGAIIFATVISYFAYK